MEYSESEYTDSDIFADRAMLSVGDTPPDHEEVGAWNILPEHAGGLKLALRQLNEVLDVGSVRFPQITMKAQAAFDC